MKGWPGPSGESLGPERPAPSDISRRAGCGEGRGVGQLLSRKAAAPGASSEVHLGNRLNNGGANLLLLPEQLDLGANLG